MHYSDLRVLITGNSLSPCPSSPAVAKNRYTFRMALYDSLAPLYDRLFPVNPKTLDFLDELAAARPDSAERRSLLDVGSATGGHVLAMARRGWRATGMEPSALMVRLAEAAGARLGAAAPRFILGAMPDQAAAVGGEGFDLVLCLGNTLPHLAGTEARARFFAAAHPLLAPGGSLVLQLLNYGRPGSGPGLAFPELRAGSFAMRRRYEAEASAPASAQASAPALRFVVELWNDDSGRVAEESTMLAPIEPPRLREELAAAGFVLRGAFGDWDGRAFSESEDQYLIVVAALGLDGARAEAVRAAPGG